jgi:TRAP-type uncharacterized transport system fused permease subunit
METSVASFKIGIAAFIVPFMFFYNGAILMDGTWFEVIRASATTVFGVYLLSSGVQGWFMGGMTAWFIRLALLLAALCMIAGGLVTDLIGIVSRRQRPLKNDARLPIAGERRHIRGIGHHEGH